jgi:flagellar biosynthetic protein FlhB
MAQPAGDRTHDPTPRRRQQARASGRVAHSHDLASAALVLAALALLTFGGSELVGFLVAFLREGLGGDGWRLWVDAGGGPPQVVTGRFNELAATLAGLLLPVLGGAALVAVAASLLQTGFLILPARVVPDASRVSPFAGFRRLFSGPSFARLAMGIFKLGVVGAVAGADLWSRREELAALVTLRPADLAVQAADICLSMGLKLGGALLALATIDYLIERWKLERELKMSPREIREETRELEGHPQIAAQRRKLRNEVH